MDSFRSFLSIKIKRLNQFEHYQRVDPTEMDESADLEIKKKKNNLITIEVRVYGQGMDSSVSHGYIVDDTPTGLSPPIGSSA